MIWRLRYSLETAGYIADNWHLIDDLIAAIRTLQKIESAIPQEAISYELGVYTWMVANHLVYYTILQDRQIIHILILKPLQQT